LFPEPFKDWTDALAAGVDLHGWWGDILAGIDRPAVFSWDALSRWRWGPAVGDLDPGINLSPPMAPGDPHDAAANAL
jgi:hypothetical protein